ncbi:hypothetical protein [Pseudomonas sp. 22 E 5]|nr:hypothetical protein [Pseudomonas sp. 22 E 5]
MLRGLLSPTYLSSAQAVISKLALRRVSESQSPLLQRLARQSIKREALRISLVTMTHQTIGKQFAR